MCSSLLWRESRGEKKKKALRGITKGRPYARQECRDSPFSLSCRWVFWRERERNARTRVNLSRNVAPRRIRTFRIRTLGMRTLEWEQYALEPLKMRIHLLRTRRLRTLRLRTFSLCKMICFLLRKQRARSGLLTAKGRLPPKLFNGDLILSVRTHPRPGQASSRPPWPSLGSLSSGWCSFISLTLFSSFVHEQKTRTKKVTAVSAQKVFSIFRWTLLMILLCGEVERRSKRSQTSSWTSKVQPKLE